jgi:nucleoside-diphosphate-sugar epimerase
MRVFVAGATGAIGRLLVPELVAAGHDVLALGRSDAALHTIAGLGATGLRGDVLDAAAMVELVAAVRPAAVINQVTDLAHADLKDNARARVEGTRNLVDASARASVGRFVSQSIAWAYEPGDGPADESTPLDCAASGTRAITVQGVLDSERAAARIADHVVLRYGALYGPGTWYSRDGLYSRRLREAAFTPSAGTVSFIHVADAASAAAAALRWPSGVVNVVDDAPARGLDWTRELCAAVGAPAADLAPAAGWERGAAGALLRSRGHPLRYPTWRGRLGRD